MTIVEQGKSLHEANHHTNLRISIAQFGYPQMMNARADTDQVGNENSRSRTARAVCKKIHSIAECPLSNGVERKSPISYKDVYKIYWIEKFRVLTTM